MVVTSEPAKVIDYTNAPKIAPFEPTHPQMVFNEFFKKRERKEPIEVEKVEAWESDGKGRRITEVESGPYQRWHELPGSKPTRPPKTPPTDEQRQTLACKGIQFTDPVELFNNFMSDQQVDITDADDEEY